MKNDRLDQLEKLWEPLEIDEGPTQHEWRGTHAEYIDYWFLKEPGCIVSEVKVPVWALIYIREQIRAMMSVNVVLGFTEIDTALAKIGRRMSATEALMPLAQYMDSIS